MIALDGALEDYLRVRRAMGYKLVRDGKLLGQFLAFLDQRDAQAVTTELALAWATLPGGSASWHANRLTVVRGFAAYLHTIDPATEVPPAGVLPAGSRRATPYLYNDQEIAALMGGAAILRSPLRAATYKTLLGLLSVTGMRIGEAIALDRGDVDSRHGLLVVRAGKFGKSRELALDPTTIAALRRYARARDRLCPSPSTPAVFVSTAGTRLLYYNVSWTFGKLARRAGLRARSGSCRPRLHDLRHTFAVRTILDAYQSDGDVHAQLALLCTWLGHLDPGATYWYLSAAPELMALAGERLQCHLEGPS